MGNDALTQGPAAEPLNLDEVKTCLRITGTDQDAQITALIISARQHVESKTNRVLIRQSRQYTLDHFPWTIELPKSPLREVSSIIYVDTSGTPQTLPDTQYQVDARSDTPRITPVFGGAWPGVRRNLNAVSVNYSGGYAVPFTAEESTDMLTALGHGLSDGDLQEIYNSGGALPAGLAVATPYYVVNVSGDDLQLEASVGGGAIDFTDNGTGTNYLGVVPRPILQAMLVYIGQSFECADGNESIDTSAIDALLSPYKVERFI